MSPLLLAAAFAADLLFGDPRRLPHPVAGTGRLISGLEALLYDRLWSRRLGGLLLAVLTLLVTGSLAGGGLVLSARLPGYSPARHLGAAAATLIESCLAPTGRPPALRSPSCSSPWRWTWSRRG